MEALSVLSGFESVQVVLAIGIAATLFAGVIALGWRLQANAEHHNALDKARYDEEVADARSARNRTDAEFKDRLQQSEFHRKVEWQRLTHRPEPTAEIDHQ
jgi:hypothetical protein